MWSTSTKGAFETSLDAESTNDSVIILMRGSGTTRRTITVTLATRSACMNESLKHGERGGGWWGGLCRCCCRWGGGGFVDGIVMG